MLPRFIFSSYSAVGGTEESSDIEGGVGEESRSVNYFAVAVTFKPVGSNQASATGTYPNVFC
jgi:hypothetical protein